jgi:hypothetical protein
MGTFWKCALVCAIPALWAPPARSADRPVPEGATVELLLLRQKSVQQDLKIPADVAKKITDFTHKQHEAVLEARKLGEEERRQKFALLEKENNQFLTETLSEGQRKRLDQITLQLTALHQLLRPRIAKALNLTPEQHEKIKDLQREARKDVEDILHSKNRDERHDKMAKHREEIRKKIEVVLTDDQKAKLKERLGEPFTGQLLFEEPQ